MESFGLVCLYGLTTIDDLKYHQVRVLEIIAFGIIGICINILTPCHTVMSILGGFMVGCLVLMFSYLSKEKIGKGDALLIMVTGLYVGFRETLTVLWISSILAAVFGSVFVKKHGTEKDMELPFVPFLLVGYLLIFMIKRLGGIVVCG